MGILYEKTVGKLRQMDRFNNYMRLWKKKNGQTDYKVKTQFIATESRQNYLCGFISPQKFK